MKFIDISKWYDTTIKTKKYYDIVHEAQIVSIEVTIKGPTVVVKEAFKAFEQAIEL